jgi:ElaB/YqjD/DUF883 family membrane-anchored ribosome-binding protein
MFSRVSSRSRAQARHAAQILNRQPARVASEEVRVLVSTVEDLIERLETAADPELVRLRQQTEAALATAKAAIGERGAQLRDRAGDLAEWGQTYVRERPWTSVGVAVLCLLAIGLWTGRAVMSE